MSISGNNWQGGIPNFKTSLTGNNNSAVSTNKVIHDPSPIFERLRKGDRTALKVLGDFIVQARDTSCLETQTLVKWKKTPLNHGQVEVKLVYLARTVTVTYTPEIAKVTLSAPKLTPEQILENKIKEMDLKETNYKGVYRQRVDEDGTSRKQKHYVWNPVTLEMKELAGVYRINLSKKVPEYGDVQAYIQGYEFTKEEGVYLKDGNKYFWSVEGKCFKRQSLTSLGSVSTNNPEIKEEPEKDPNAVYDENGNMISKKFFDENNRIKAEEFYDTDGNIISSTTYTYNSNGTYTTTVKNNDGTQIQKEFDSNNNLISEKNYNAEGQLISNIIYDANGNKLSEQVLEYDLNGILIAEVQLDASGNKMVNKEFVYNADGSYTEINLSNDGTKVENEFDKNGKLVSSKTFDDKGRVTKEENYDQFGNITESFEYTYNTDGTYIKKYTDRGNNTIEEKYSSDDKLLNATVTDQYGRIISETEYYTWGGIKGKTEYSYESGVTTKTIISGNTKIIQELNDNGQVVSEQKVGWNGTLQYKIIYNEKGDILSHVKYSYLGKGQYGISEQIEYVYHENGNYTEIITDASGNRTEKLLTKDGKIIEEKNYYADGKLKKCITYDSNGKPELTQEYSYNKDGSYTVREDSPNTTAKEMQYTKDGKLTFEVIYDKNGNLLSEIEYYPDGNINVIRDYYENGTLKAEKTRDPNTNLFVIIEYDKNGNQAKLIYTDNDGNTVKEIRQDGEGNTVTTTYKNGIINKEVVVTSNGQLLEEILYDINGNLSLKREYTYTKASKKDIKFNGKYYTVNIDAKTTITEYNANNNKVRNIILDSVVEPTELPVTYTYEIPVDGYIDENNYELTVKYSNGDTAKIAFKNGIQRCCKYYDCSKGNIKVTDYDEKGNDIGPSWKNVTAKPISKSRYVSYVGNVTVTMGAYDIYKAITNLDNVAVKAAGVVSYTGSSIVKTVAGNFSEQFLRYAQADYNGTPSGCSVKYNNFEAVSNEYQEFIKNDILKNITEEYGYTPEQVKGYKFSSSSAISKKMAGDSNLKTYVKNNIKALINGNPPSNGIVFNSDADLKGSFHGTSVLSSKLNGTKLTLTIYDMYDFNSKASDILNQCGAAAMKDGLLKPYFSIVEVTIDLKTLGFTQAQINAMKNS